MPERHERVSALVQVRTRRDGRMARLSADELSADERLVVALGYEPACQKRRMNNLLRNDISAKLHLTLKEAGSLPSTQVQGDTLRGGLEHGAKLRAS